MNQKDESAFLPLPQPAPRRTAAARRDATRDHVRRVTAWAAAAVVAGMAGGAGYFAHAAAPGPSTTTQVTTAPAHGSRPGLSHPIATSGGSGVTPGGAATSGAAGSAGGWRDN